MQSKKSHPVLYIVLVLLISWVVQTVLFTGIVPQIPIVLYMFVPAVLAFLFFLFLKNPWRKQALLFTSGPVIKSLAFAFIYPFVWFSLAAILALITGTGKINCDFVPSLVSGPFISSLLLAFLILLPSMFGEEYGWRGYLLPALTEKYSKTTSAIVVGGVWGAWHIPSYYLAYVSADMGNPFLMTLLGIAVTFVASFPYAYCFFLSRNIIPLVVLHGVHDLTAQAIFFGSPGIPGLQEAQPALISINWPAPLLFMFIVGLVFVPLFIKLFTRLDQKKRRPILEKRL
ncbi:MAG: type II CAAX endopeptidase family protein [Smithellaceae bacterium]|nr:type II CAAX endopeptidase family protein [Smithellaceae bacterium]